MPNAHTAQSLCRHAESRRRHVIRSESIPSTRRQARLLQAVDGVLVIALIPLQSIINTDSMYQERSLTLVDGRNATETCRQRG